MVEKQTVGIGLVGSGFMGRCHANAFRSVSGLFDLSVTPVPELLADATHELAHQNAVQLGYARSTDDWSALCHDPKVDIVAVTAPNVLHEPIVLEAIEAGKAVYCEKPLSTTLESAERMARAARDAKTLTLVGFNFLRNPLIALTKQLIDSGEIGEVVNFRGRHAENYMCDPATPHSFRTAIDGGGALADIGSHIISMARFLFGDFSTVMAESTTVFKQRPRSAGSSEMKRVEVDDITNAVVRFANGASGTIEANWVAQGRTMDLSFEITGTKGAIYFTQERMNELRVTSNVPGRTGFVKIESGPQHAPYGNFCPAPGHHLGFNDLKVIEVAELLHAYANNSFCKTDFDEAVEVQRVVHAMQQSARNGASVQI